MDELLPSFSESLFNQNTKDLIIDYAELGIDTIIGDELLKDIPIVKLIIGTSKIIQSIHDRNLLKQTLIFINEFNSQTISPEKLEKYKNKITKNRKYFEKELGRVLILLNRNIENEKSRYLSRLYANYINKNITWEEFTEFCDVTERLFLSDIDILNQIYINKGVKTNENITYRYERLTSLGLIINKDGIFNNIYWNGTDEDNITYVYTITDMGQRFCHIIFN